ncbi:tetratricopeptide repeat protein [Paraburkholderia sp. MM5477-R1]|uniref:tetratricopeptide repeat protein n=1 Tax=Paraburkholderia sp. MM5477-R1 TaxID=2991062 RepID=UPI003D221B50
MKSLPIPVRNAALAVALIALVRVSVWYFLGWQVQKSELWSVIGGSVAGGFVHQLLPKTSKTFITKTFRQILASRLTTPFLLTFVTLLCLPILMVGYIQISWRGPTAITVKVNSKEKTFSSEESPSALYQDRAYGMTFSSLNFEYGNWRATKKIFPLTTEKAQIPAWMTVASFPQFSETEEQLSMAYFQFFEIRYITAAKNKISSIKVSEAQRPAAERLQFIYQIINLAFSEPDLSDAKSVLIGNFTSRYPDDPWTPFLKAARYYAQKKYVECADALSNAGRISGYPKNSTARFFRGVCLLDAARDAQTVAQKQSRTNDAIESFRSAEAISRTDRVDGYRSLAYPSSIYFQAISSYYLGKTDETISLFKRASEFATGSLKARTLNGIGYIELSRGHTDKAEVALQAAMESDPNFPLARSNYGYVLLDKNDFKTASEIFEKNASDEKLRLESYKDVVLAKLALVFLSELSGAQIHDTIFQYLPILKDRQIQDFEGVVPEELRLAYIHRAIADGIYLSKSFYGLEVFALALQTRAYLEAIQMKKNFKEDARIDALLTSLSADIQHTEKLVSSDWLNRPEKGWFATIAKYRSTFEANEKNISSSEAATISQHSTEK